MDPEFRGTARFELVRELGHGGMGVVYEAFDRERGARVALKALPRLDGELLLRLKNEFRALLDLAHPNLVRLGELVEHQGVWFFTMELVDGVDFLAWVHRGEGRELALGTPAVSTVAGSEDVTLPATAAAVLAAGAAAAAAEARLPPARPVVDDARLRDALDQLAQGLGALHAAGKVHRDIKPSNVMVTAAGRVVLLDFGLVVPSEAAVPSGVMVGTIPYMAPEQLDQPPTPAADCYALGAMLYEALTGDLPVIGNGFGALQRKREIDPAPPSAVVADVAPELDRLCVELLDRDPALRPTAAEVRRRLGQVAVEAAPLGLIGRGDERARLRAAVAAARGGPRLIVLRGESGVGKSALLRWLGDEVTGQGGLVLAARCHQRESVPFQTVDGVIDALSEALLIERGDRRRFGAVDGLAAAAALFPVLGRVLDAAPAAAQLDPVEQVRRATAALRRQLHVIADVAPVVIAIDDIQWADGDGAALLAALVRAPEPPRVLIAVTVRGDGAVPALALAPAAIDELAIGPLSVADARDLARRLGGERSDGELDDLTAEAGGHPMFIAELARHAGTARGRRLDEALAARAARLPAAARRLLETLAVAERPTEPAVLTRASELEPDVADAALTDLRGAGLIRQLGAGRGERIEPAHDRVRAAIADRLDDGAARGHHRRLGAALAALAPTEHEAQSRHALAVGDRARAAHHARRAAERAVAALAWGRAAALWQQVIDLDGAADVEVHVARAVALARAGRGRDAGLAYLAAAALAPAGRALLLEASAIEQLLHSGQLAAGLDVIHRTLGRIGLRLPATAAAAVPGLVVRRARVRLRSLDHAALPPAERSLGELARVDLFWSIATGMALVDHVRGADFQARHYLAGMRCGDPVRAARALMMEACYSATGGSRTARRTEAVLAAAARAAASTGDPHALAMVAHAESVVACCGGRWRDAVVHADRALALFRDRCVDVSWQINDSQLFALTGLAMQGAVGELCARADGYRAEAAARGNLWSTTGYVIGGLVLDALAHDEPGLARGRAAAEMARWTTPGFLVQHALHTVGEALIDLYQGDDAAALARLVADQPALRRSRLDQVQLIRVQYTQVTARAALRTGQGAIVDDAIAALRAERVAWAAALAELLTAQRLAATDAAAGARALDAAAVALAAVDFDLLTLAARRRAGELRGGDDGRAAVDRVDGALIAMGVVDPPRFARAHVL